MSTPCSCGPDHLCLGCLPARLCRAHERLLTDAVFESARGFSLEPGSLGIGRGFIRGLLLRHGPSRVDPDLLARQQACPNCLAIEVMGS